MFPLLLLICDWGQGFSGHEVECMSQIPLSLNTLFIWCFWARQDKMLSIHLQPVTPACWSHKEWAKCHILEEP